MIATDTIFEAAVKSTASLIREYEGDGAFRSKIDAIDTDGEGLVIAWKARVLQRTARQYARVLNGELASAGWQGRVRHQWRKVPLFPKPVRDILAHLIERGDGRVEFAEAFDAYRRACAAAGLAPVNISTFADELRAFCRECAIEIEGDSRGGKAWLVGVRLVRRAGA
jgi:hypothetical protein